MSLSAARPGVSGESRRESWVLLLLIWLVAVVTLGATSGIDHVATDDAMHRVEVRDFLAGQNWFDLTQYRLNPPAGVVMHWSRLVDLPLAFPPASRAA
jgi:hypothetical protein